jgi:hypothetical protein
MKKSIKIIGFFILGSFASFFVYANLESKPLHANASPADIFILKVEKPLNNEERMALKNEFESVVGISSFSSNGLLVSVVFNPEKMSREALKLKLDGKMLTYEKASFENRESNSPQCPVPHGYILAFEKFKYALNIR